jgi:hypothetical protein
MRLGCISFVDATALICFNEPLVVARIVETKGENGESCGESNCQIEVHRLATAAITRQKLVDMGVAIYKFAESDCNPTAIVAAIRLLSELAQISLRAPQDRPHPSQHVHPHSEGLVDRPPQETLEQCVTRKQRSAKGSSSTPGLRVDSDN